jgi:hypothetical protein
LVQWLRLAPDRRLLVVEAAVLLVAVRAGLRLVPFQRLNRLARRLSRPRRVAIGASRPASEPLVWAVDRVGLALLGPRACLTIALAGQILLGRRGIPSRLRIGVLKKEGGRLVGHAWLEGEEGVLLGGVAAELQRFVPLPDLEAAGG